MVGNSASTVNALPRTIGRWTELAPILVLEPILLLSLFQEMGWLERSALSARWAAPTAWFRSTRCRSFVFRPLPTPRNLEGHRGGRFRLSPDLGRTSFMGLYLTTFETMRSMPATGSTATPTIHRCRKPESVRMIL